MTLYLDMFFLVNFIMNYLIFNFLGYLLGLKRKRLFVGSVFVSSITIFSLFCPIPNFFRIIVGLMFVYITFGYYNKKQFISLSLLYYLINISLGGLTFIINSSININLLLSSFIIICLFVAIDKLVFDSNLEWKTTIFLNGKKTVAYVDTGNLALIDGLSICFIKSELSDKLEYARKCEITTINGTKIINLYKAEIVVNKCPVDCYLSISDDIPGEMLISPHLLKFKGEISYDKGYS
ncbi:sigma-E processing peptidase SpoIIGA [Mycoplasmatota bacterium]|nr:sigma-E processing peptidase SpoIIGA [Mycoplasmatota bacterium]